MIVHLLLSEDWGEISKGVGQGSLGDFGREAAHSSALKTHLVLEEHLVQHFYFYYKRYIQDSHC